MILRCKSCDHELHPFDRGTYCPQCGRETIELVPAKPPAAVESKQKRRAKALALRRRGP